MNTNNYEFFRVDGSNKRPCSREEVVAAARQMGYTTDEQIEKRLYGLPSVPLAVPQGMLGHTFYNRELTAAECAEFEPPIEEGER